jgi:uncharacterized surface protein with fasciclin (FAS1) repeats
MSGRHQNLIHLHLQRKRMTANRLLTAAAATALAVGLTGAAWAQTPATAQTQSQAQAATGKATTDAPANTARQGTAAVVAQGTGAAPAAQPAAPAAPAAASVHIAPAGDIVQTLQAGGQFTTLIAALNATNLTPVLKNNKGLTLFAPTDAAFAATGDVKGQIAKGDQAYLSGLQKLLLHHIINAEVDSSKFKGAHGPVNDGAGGKIVLDGVAAPKADQANILQADVRASNGLIHVVDQVLKAGSVPETLPQEEQPAPAAAEPPKEEPKKAAPAKKKGTKRGH